MAENGSSPKPSPTAILNGHVIDPANQLNAPRDVLIVDGKIAEVGMPGSFTIPPNSEVFDAAGCLVTPGLIDMHVHCYEHATPLGVNADRYCLGRGVTTAVDAGSAGATTLPGLHKFIAEKSKTRVLAFVNISLHGMASAGCAGYGQGGELDHLNQVKVQSCADAIKKNRDFAVGVKVRLTADVADNGKNEVEAFKRALEARKLAGVPLMVHHSCSSIPVKPNNPEEMSCPGDLEKGDIRTHMFHAYNSSIIHVDSAYPFQCIFEARDRGVLFDVGHGQGSFSWTVAEICGGAKLWPDTISSDLHSGCYNGPAYDLVTIMSKMLFVKMPIEEVIRAVTVNPAKAIGWQDRIGTLSVGAEADVTILRIDPVKVKMEDCQAQIREIDKRIVPVAVWRAGERYQLTPYGDWPNEVRQIALSREWDKLALTDIERPAALDKKLPEEVEDEPPKKQPKI